MARHSRPLTGQVVAITGGTRGIGHATAAALVRRGARVAIGAPDGERARRVAAELGDGVVGWPLDVTDAASFAAFLDAVEERLGPLDALVNNAGIMLIGPFADEPPAAATRMVDVNLLGVITGAKLALARFLPRGRGHLVNVASTAGKTGLPGGATYAATKFGVVGLTEALRAELRGTGIATTVVLPMPVRTELGAGLHPLRGMPPVAPEAVAEAIAAVLERPRDEVYVPPRMGRIMRMAQLLPRRTAEAVARAMGTERVLAHADAAARADYERRALAGAAAHAAGGEAAGGE